MPCSALTARTPDAGTLAELHFPQARATDLAVLATATVDKQFLLEIPRLPIATNEIAQRGAAALDGGSEDAFDLDRQLQVTRPGNALGFAARIDAGGEQRFGRVDIADPTTTALSMMNGLTAIDRPRDN